MLTAHPHRPSRALRHLLLVAATSLLVLLPSAAAPVAASAATKDPVAAAISSALAKGAITPAQAKQFRGTWAASARAARLARTSTRRANVAVTRTYATNLARSGGLIADRLEPVLLSVQATTYVMLASTSFPGHEQEIQIPAEPNLVFTYYSGRGVQFQPFETFKLGVKRLNEHGNDDPQARAIADRMRDLAITRGNALIWEYYFPFGGPSRPWTSAISQALGTEFFHRVGQGAPEGEGGPYAAVATAMVRSFLRAPSAGGVATPQGRGRFYVMYSFNPGQRILNGHLQVLINVNRVAVATGSAEARQVVSLGLAAVLPMLPRFDTGAWSNYQPGQEAELGYHEFQTDQLVKLGNELANVTLQEYGARFTLYLETPPQITPLATSWPTLIPARDGFRDTIVVRYRTDKRAKVTMRVADMSGREVRLLYASSGRGTASLVWDGRDGSGRTVPDGEYTASLTATDIVGNRERTDLDGVLVVERDVVAPELGSVSVRAAGAGASVVTVRASDAGSAWVDAEVRVGGRLVATRRGPHAGSITLRVPASLASTRAGQLTLRDSSGNASVHALSG